nr:MAG TPA: hypothetical protein [Caudoviricetes sp.]
MLGSAAAYRDRLPVQSVFSRRTAATPSLYPMSSRRLPSQ